MSLTVSRVWQVVVRKGLVKAVQTFKYILQGNLDYLSLKKKQKLHWLAMVGHKLIFFPFLIYCTQGRADKLDNTTKSFLFFSFYMTFDSSLTQAEYKILFLVWANTYTIFR